MIEKKIGYWWCSTARDGLWWQQIVVCAEGIPLLSLFWNKRSGGIRLWRKSDACWRDLDFMRMYLRWPYDENCVYAGTDRSGTDREMDGWLVTAWLGVWAIIKPFFHKYRLAYLDAKYESPSLFDFPK